MEKIILYDENDVKIGETFMRRARQLVKQQRGEWTDDSQTAVKFFPDKSENWETVEVEDGSLVELAKARIRERSWIIVHSIAFIPGLFFLIIFIANFFNGDTSFALGFVSGSWITAYAILLCQHLIRNRRRLFGSDERRARRLATEIAILKEELHR